MKIFLIVLAVVVIAIIFLTGIYNRLVALLNEAKNSFAQIDVQLKRRYDLIPNLVEIAKKYMSYEESVLVKVVNARNSAIGALEKIEKDGLKNRNLNDLSLAETDVQSALKGLNIQVEAYPDLKANQNMMQLSKVGFARQAYNDSVTAYNTYKQSFPNNILVGFFPKFHEDLGLLEFKNEDISAAPKIKF